MSAHNSLQVFNQQKATGITVRPILFGHFLLRFSAFFQDIPECARLGRLLLLAPMRRAEEEI
jgi:hypothetical protein